MFERFTKHARRVTVMASVTAKELKHNYVCPGHFFLALLQVPDEITEPYLTNVVGFELEACKALFTNFQPVGSSDVNNHIPFTPGTKKVLEYSLREALALGHNNIGSEHILLGLIRQEDEQVAALVAKQDYDLERLRDSFLDVIHNHEPGNREITISLDPEERDAIIKSFLQLEAYMGVTPREALPVFARLYSKLKNGNVIKLKSSEVTDILAVFSQNLAVLCPTRSHPLYKLYDELYSTQYSLPR